jgi:hypothetical protein
MVKTKYVIPIIFLSKKFNLPYEISKIIHDFIINSSAQKIINSWYNYIYIHNIYLCEQISKLNTLQSNDINGEPFFYYDINDHNTKFTLFTCSRNIRPKISSENWWKNHVGYFFNGLYHDNINNNTLSIYNSYTNQNNHDYIFKKICNILGCF